MIKYKRVLCEGLEATVEHLFDMLSGMAGKNRRIVSIGTEYSATVAEQEGYLRVYRDAEQIVDCDLTKLNIENRWLPMDLPLAEGQQCRVGTVGRGVIASTSLEVTVGYEEAG